MSGGGIGPPEFSVRTSAGVERTGSATDRQKHRNPRQEQRDQQQERRDQGPPNPQRRRLFDLLFEEVDNFEGLDDRQRARLKANLRAHLTARTPPPKAASPPPDRDEEAIARAALADPAAAIPIDHDGIIHAALTPGGEVEPAAGADPALDEAAENARLAEQLRNCLASNTDRARKVAVYLHLLLTIDGALRPHMVLDI